MLFKCENILSMSYGQNRKEHNKCGPTFKHIPKLKVSSWTKPKFTLEISISVQAKTICNAVIVHGLV